MVIQDSSHSHKRKPRFRSPKVKEEWPLASPVDRLAATVVDFIILIPLISLAFALVKKELTLAQYLGTNPELHFLMTVYYVVSPVIIHVLFQTVFLCFLGATPGKYFFGLKVNDVWTHRYPHWQRALFRSLAWWVDIVLLLPLISMFWDSKRRPIHDRLSDTIVTSVETRSVSPPGFFETQFSRFVFLALVLSGVAYLFGKSPELYQLAVRNGIEVSDWVGGKDTCEAVDKAENAWPQGEAKGRRLKIALALFAARTIENECLNAEADHYIWIENKEGEDQGIGYLAKAFATLEKPETSDSYLSQVCESDSSSESCLMSRVFSSWSDQNWEEVEKAFTKLDLQASAYVKVWAVRHYFRTGKVDKAAELIEQMSPNFALADFLGEYRIKSLWRGDDSEQAESLFKLYWESRDNHDRLHLANWLCYEEMLRSCSGEQSPSCQTLQRAVSRFPTIQEEAKVALTQLHWSQCRKEKIPENKFYSKEVGALAEALDPQRWDKKEMYSSLKTFAEDASRSEVVRFDALWQAIEFAGEEQQLADLEKIWLSFESNERWNWSVLGHRFSQKFARLGKSEKALSIAQKVYQANSEYREILKHLVELNFKSGNRQQAWKWLKEYRPGKRLPASLGDWESMESVLRREFDSP